MRNAPDNKTDKQKSGKNIMRKNPVKVEVKFNEEIKIIRLYPLIENHIEVYKDNLVKNYEKNNKII